MASTGVEFVPQAPYSNVPALEFRGTGLWLFVFHFGRGLCALLGLASLFLALVAFVVQDRETVRGWLDRLEGPAARDINVLLRDLIKLTPEALAGVPYAIYIVLIPVSLLGAVALSDLARRYLVNNTWAFGRQLLLRERPATLLLSKLVNVLLMLVTLGLAGPWVLARKLRFRYRSMTIRDNPEQTLDFKTDGFNVLGQGLFQGLLYLLAPFSLGISAVLAAFYWISWESSRVMIPDEAGTLHPMVFQGNVSQYWGLGTRYGFLLVLTLGLAHPWYAVALLRWRYANTIPLMRTMPYGSSVEWRPAPKPADTQM